MIFSLYLKSLYCLWGRRSDHLPLLWFAGRSISTETSPDLALHSLTSASPWEEEELL